MMNSSSGAFVALILISMIVLVGTLSIAIPTELPVPNHALQRKLPPLAGNDRGAL